MRGPALSRDERQRSSLSGKVTRPSGFVRHWLRLLVWLPVLVACDSASGMLTLGPRPGCQLSSSVPCGPAACLADGSECTTNGQCCGHVCSVGVCGPPRCHANGENCGSSLDCCANLGCL